MYDTPWELYDMKMDRSELKDLSKGMPGKAKELRLLYEAWAKRVDALPWKEVLEARKKKIAK
jgi:arylsulfatase